MGRRSIGGGRIIGGTWQVTSKQSGKIVFQIVASTSSDDEANDPQIEVFLASRKEVAKKK